MFQGVGWVRGRSLRELLLALLHDQQAEHPETAWLLVARTLMNLDEFVTRE